MDINIVSTNDAPLFARKEIEAKITFTGATPSRAVLVKELATAVKSKPELVVIQKIENHFGTEQASVTAHVYDKAEAVKEHEPEHMLKRLKEEPVKEEEAPAEEKKEEAPAEAPKEVAAPVEEAAPAEEKKEEAPAEEKKGDE